jgi:FkbM family methyltransferase
MNFRQKVQNVFFPLGSIQRIRRGYLKDYRIRLTENSLWSPILGRWEPAMQKIMVNVVKEGQVAYDLGANNGMHGLLLSQLIGKKGIVYNFEPFETNIKELTENFSLNNITNYKTVQAAVSDAVKEVSFVTGQHNKQGHIADSRLKATDTINIKAITLDSFIEEGNRGPDFMKVDIEGAEGAALNGFSKNVEKYFPLMIIELHSPEQDLLVGEFLRSHKYTAYRFDPGNALSFEKIKDLSKPYPDPDGIWGSLFCVGPDKKFEDFSFTR